MQQAIDYEARRQIELVEEGKTVDQETRLFDTKKHETRSMRSKEDAHDYRYFPDPDLLPLELDNDYVESLKKDLPELPDQKKERLINEFKLSNYEASVIISDQAVSSYYEEVAKNSDYKLAATWLMGDLFASLNKEGIDISESPVSAVNLAKMINLIKDGTISGKIAKTVFEEMIKSDGDPSKIVEEQGLKQTSDPKEIEGIIENVLSNNQDKVEQYKSGKDKLFGFFVGQVMKEMKGKGNPQMINDILKDKLK